MDFIKRCVWLLAIMIGYLVFKSRYTVVSYLSKRQAGQNHGEKKTMDVTESLSTKTTDIVTTEIAGDERLQIGHYVSRINPYIIGKEFNFDNSTLAVVRRVLRDQTFKRKPIESVDAKTPFFDLVTPVTTCSSNHYGEFKPRIEEFRKSFPGTKCFFYDLGLSDEQINEVKNMPDLVYRKFDFNAYPEHVRNLQNYAWKPLIIQEMLSEFDGTMWFDSSVRFLGNLTSNVIELMSRHNTGAVFYLDSTHHSIVAATQPGMLEYFPMMKEGAVKDMLQASAVIYINKDEVQRHIMKWVVICALKKDCIAPPGSKLFCGFNFPRDRFGGCHRYDQSLQNILVSNAYNHKHEKYHYWSKDFAIMARRKLSSSRKLAKERVS